MCEPIESVNNSSNNNSPLFVQKARPGTLEIRVDEKKENGDWLTPGSCRSSCASSVSSACSYTSEDLELIRSRTGDFDMDMSLDEIDETDQIFRQLDIGQDPLTPTRTQDLFSNNDYWSCDPSVGVSLRVDSSPSAPPPKTIVQIFQEVVQDYGSNLALAVKRAGMWRKWSYIEYYESCITVAKAFIKLGLEPHHSVCIIGFNSPEWHISLIAAIMAGGIGVGLYLTSTPDGCYHVANSSRANIFVVENDSQLEKVLQIRDRLPDLKAIVHYSDLLAGKPEDECIFNWDRLLTMDTSSYGDELETRMSQLSPNKCCSLLYTSGTTGKPKGVMLSHDNFSWMSHSFMEHTKCVKGKEKVISYLPLAHVAPQLMDVFVTMKLAGSCWFAQPNAMKGSLLETLREVHPTVFLGVPRVWEKIAENMRLVMSEMSGFKGWLRKWAQGIGLKGNQRRQSGGVGTPFGWTIANITVFNKVKKLLGLDQCHWRLTGSAPISPDTLTYFMSVNLPIYELYGMTECCGSCTVTTNDTIRFKAAGVPLPGIDLRISNSQGPDHGEVQIMGRCLMMGYIGDLESTARAFTRDGYLKTGDVGHVSKEGFLYITGRMKEMIVTSAGDMIAPVPIESIIKDEAPLISNVVLIGDQRDFLVCLITLKVDFDDSTGSSIPTDRLNATARAVCNGLGVQASIVSDVKDPQKGKEVLKTIQTAIDKANKSVTLRQHKIVKWSILDTDFSVEGGELSSTLKLKRMVIADKYATIIDLLYS